MRGDNKKNIETLANNSINIDKTNNHTKSHNI